MTLYRVILIWLITAAVVAGVVAWANASPASDARQAARGEMAAYRKAHPNCEWCGTSGHIGNRLEVHHIIPCAVAPAKATDGGNMVALCRRCHCSVGHVGDPSMRRYLANIRAVMAVREVRP